MLSDTRELLLNGFTAQVQFCQAATVTEPIPWWIWELVPVKVESATAPPSVRWKFTFFSVFLSLFSLICFFSITFQLFSNLQLATKR